VKSLKTIAFLHAHTITSILFTLRYIPVKAT